MATIGNVLQRCAANYKNTGYGSSCFTEFGAPIGVILASQGDSIPLTGVAAAKTYITSKLLNSTPSLRFYPVQAPIDPKDNSEDSVIVTSTLGQKKKIRDGFASLQMSWWDGGMCLLIPLRLMNGMKQPLYILTSYGFLIGTDKGDGLCSPINLTYFDAKPFKWSAGNDSNGYMIDFTYDPKQTNENVKFIDFSKDGGLGYLQSLIGLQNIVITKQARVVALLTVGLSTSCGGVDLATIYPTQFIASTWKAWADNAGVIDYTKPIAITSATPTADGYAIQITVADANYTAGAPIWLGNDTPANLLTAGIGAYDGSTGFEGLPVSIGL
jgi:hypothetical protein